MRVIYLHIGRGKTGTTTVQKYLSQRRQELLDQGVDYLFTDDRGRGAGHQHFAKSFISEPPHYLVPAVQPEIVRQAIGDEIAESQADVGLISSENFPLADVSRVAAFFRDLPGHHRVKVVFFVRSQDELAESEYNQMVKLKEETRSFEEYIRSEASGYDFYEEACKWERHFGRENMICRVYNASRQDAVYRLLACIPEICADRLSPFSPGEGSTAANSSVGLKALIVARLLNGIGLAKRPRRYEEIFRQLADDDLPALLFDSPQARQFRAEFAESNRAFSERFIGEPRDDLGGRRYSDEERDSIRGRIAELKLLGL